MCSSCNLKVVPQIQASNYTYTIPIQEFSNKGSSCKFKVFYCTSSTKVNALLKPYGITLNSMEDAGKLGKYHDAGYDVQKYNVDFSKLLDTIVFTPEELNKTECDLACTY